MRCGGFMANKPIDDSLYFLRRFLRRPRHVASIWPSSRHLAREMFRGLQLEPGDLVLEYGPGTGSFTVEVERLRRQGVAVRYLGIEKDAGLHAFLEERFPDLEFVLGDAADVARICRDRRLPPATAVISGLPLIFLDRPVLRSILSVTAACLRSDGVFRTFSYVHSYPTRGAADLRHLMGACFDRYQLSSPVLRNLPPAFVLTGQWPRMAAAHQDLGLELLPAGERVR
jgi:phospholipid N-methyltransferase